MFSLHIVHHLPPRAYPTLGAFFVAVDARIQERNHWGIGERFITYEYTTREGQTFSSLVFDDPSYRSGMKVFYDPANPAHSFTSQTWKGRRLAITIVGVIGLVTLFTIRAPPRVPPFFQLRRGGLYRRL